jgi:Zn-dependent oligopeptidase
MPIFSSKRKTKRLDDFIQITICKNESTKDRTFQTYVFHETYRNETFLIDFNEVLTLFHEFGHDYTGC